MRRCTYCHAEIPDGELICPSCGREVQLVPDYEPFDILSDDQGEEHEGYPENFDREQRYGSEKSPFEDDGQGDFPDRKKKLRLFLIAGFAFLAAMLLLFFFLSPMMKKKDAAVTSSSALRAADLAKASELLEEKSYEKALALIEKYLKRFPADQEGLLIKAKSLVGLERMEEAERLLPQLDIEHQAEIYELFFSFYLEKKDYDSINRLYAGLREDSIRGRFSQYQTAAPVFLPDKETIDEPTEIEITSEIADGTIYYTIDGSEPTSSSAVYTGGISLDEEGSFTIRALVYNKLGIPGKEGHKTYAVHFEAPDEPEIKTKTGSYETGGALTSITVLVPEGFTCYYSFDTLPDKASNRYEGPVPMIMGEHTFYAILEDEKTGKLSPPSTMTFNYKKTAAKPPLEDYGNLNPSEVQKPVDDGDDGSNTVDDQEGAAEEVQRKAEEAAKKEVLKIWDPENQKLLPGATRQKYENVLQMVKGLREGPARQELEEYLSLAAAKLGS